MTCFGAWILYLMCLQEKVAERLDVFITTVILEENFIH